MRETPDPGDDPLKRLDERLDAFDAERRRKRPVLDLGQGGGASAAYRVLAQMLGGVFGGLGLGWLLDRVAHTKPWGLIGGLLIGTTTSIVMMIRAASRANAPGKTGNTDLRQDDF
jgi:ATP synthase protein I